MSLGFFRHTLHRRAQAILVIVICKNILLFLPWPLVQMTRRAHDTWSRSSKSWYHEGWTPPAPRDQHLDGTVGTAEGPTPAPTRTNVRAGATLATAVTTTLPRSTRTGTKTRTMARGQGKKRSPRRRRRKTKKKKKKKLKYKQ